VNTSYNAIMTSGLRFFFNCVSHYLVKLWAYSCVNTILFRCEH